jgi:hypothetical protein
VVHAVWDDMSLHANGQLSTRRAHADCTSPAALAVVSYVVLVISSACMPGVCRLHLVDVETTGCPFAAGLRRGGTAILGQAAPHITTETLPTTRTHSVVCNCVLHAATAPGVSELETRQARPLRCTVASGQARVLRVGPDKTRGILRFWLCARSPSERASQRVAQGPRSTQP